MDSYKARDVVGFDPNNAEDCKTTLGEIIEFINAERAAAGRGKAKSIVVAGVEIPYEKFEGEDPFQEA